MLKNGWLTESYSELIQIQWNLDTAAQIANINRLYLPFNDAAAALGGAVALETIRPSTTAADDAPTSINSVGYDEAAIEILEQGLMNLSFTSARYCVDLVKMNLPCSSRS